jgi:hypothetical protein
MMKQCWIILLFFGLCITASAQSAAPDTLDIALTPFSLPSDHLKDGFYKVETEAEYKELQRTVREESGNSRFGYPKINFSKYILMGCVFQMNSCEKVTLEERLYELPKQQKICYKLYVVQFGQCTESVLIKRWMLIKKKKGATYQFDNRIVEKKETRQ